MTQPNFLKDRNEKQFKHQKEVLEILDDVEKAISRNEMEQAKESIEKGRKLVKKRIKLIRIADREDWETVREYVSDDLASGTDDEKDIAKAIKAAAAKKEKRKKLKPKPAGSKTGWRKTFRGSYFTNQNDSRRNNFGKPQGTCWTCGKIGHMQWQCFRNNSNNK